MLLLPSLVSLGVRHFLSSTTRSTSVEVPLSDAAKDVNDGSVTTVSREPKLLVDHREDLLRERVRIQARLRWHLHELFPGMAVASRSLRRKRVLDALDQRLGGVQGTVA